MVYSESTTNDGACGLLNSLPLQYTAAMLQLLVTSYQVSSISYKTNFSTIYRLRWALIDACFAFFIGFFQLLTSCQESSHLKVSLGVFRFAIWLISTHTLTTSAVTIIVRVKMTHVTVSEHGGVVNEPS